MKTQFGNEYKAARFWKEKCISDALADRNQLHADRRPAGPTIPGRIFVRHHGFSNHIDKIAAIMQFSFPREYSRKIFPPTVVLISLLSAAEQNPANREFAEVDRMNQQRRAGTEMPKP